MVVAFVGKLLIAAFALASAWALLDPQTTSHFTPLVDKALGNLQVPEIYRSQIRPFEPYVVQFHGALFALGGVFMILGALSSAAGKLSVSLLVIAITLNAIVFHPFWVATSAADQAQALLGFLQVTALVGALFNFGFGKKQDKQ
ncbi:hypothetical protein CAOG_06998 [Capsaspora owczarzaki ATCC 30864]|uniref:DoxX family protein n=1 Tax=Capsaspora owczarzaki (strain ATCC 30864) TaxID=595528 RepID=A0A0D2VYD0_CAPO3|nr:hypothetical protein CAOG_06998 [Capsaspora owczarzaki ATCC 30864]KJE96722.1 hypothetical protein CAOG_006998 [Capsaspora owczarzaki ATCC 30864]|eukprot:XP_004343722.1 hypothetical protein CAOG_06998 [Capsaspora owczarzaki ATCC 30864]